MECEQADRARLVIRQGDVLAAHPETDNWSNRWARFFIVLSADCDIVNSKLDTGLVVVPVIGLRTYASEVWLPEQIRRQMISAEKKVETSLHRFSGTSFNSSSAMSTAKSVLIDELSRSVGEDAQLVKVLSTISDLHDCHTELRALVQDLASAPSPALRELITRFCLTKSRISGNSIDPQKELKTGFSGVSDSKRTDLWPICDLVGLDGQMKEDERDGFVAMLRRFTQIPIDHVITNKAEWLRLPHAYLRVCRLRGIYKSDFLHRFANLFTRVGLDAGREDEHQIMFELAASKIFKTGERS